MTETGKVVVIDPYALGVLVSMLCGKDWIQWAPSVLRQTLAVTHQIELTAEMMNKLQGWRLAATHNGPWENFPHFHAITHALNGHAPSILDHLPHTVGEMMLAVETMGAVRHYLGLSDLTPEFSEEVAKYIAATAHIDGCWSLIAPLDFALPYVVERRYRCNDCGQDAPVHFDDDLCDVCAGRVTHAPESLDTPKIIEDGELSGKEQWSRVTLQAQLGPNKAALSSGRGRNITKYIRYDPVAPVTLLGQLVADPTKDLPEVPERGCAYRLLDALIYIGAHTADRTELLAGMSDDATELAHGRVQALRTRMPVMLASGVLAQDQKVAADDLLQEIRADVIKQADGWWDDGASFAREMWQDAKAVPGQAWEAARAAPGQVWGAAKAAPGAAWEAAKAAPGAAWDAAKAAPGAAWDFAKSAPARGWAYAKTVPGQVWEGAVDAARVGANMTYRPQNVLGDVKQWWRDPNVGKFGRALTFAGTAHEAYGNMKRYDPSTGQERGAAERALSTAGGLWGSAAGLRTGMLGSMVTNVLGSGAGRFIGKKIDQVRGFQPSRQLDGVHLNPETNTHFDFNAYANGRPQSQQLYDAYQRQLQGERPQQAHPQPVQTPPQPQPQPQAQQPHPQPPQPHQQPHQQPPQPQAQPPQPPRQLPVLKRPTGAPAPQQPQQPQQPQTTPPYGQRS